MPRRAFFPGLALIGAALLLVPAPRCLAAPRLTEFMASNDRSIADEDGHFSDWIEIHNPDALPADLSGHYLTDDPGELTKWALPAGTTLASDAYLLVFASGKDRRAAGAELHTNFQMDADGEFVALVSPGGTVLSAFGSASTPYPRQRGDISYGSGEAALETPLVPEGAALRYLVPSHAGELSPQWNAATFDDSGWTAGAFGIGFDLDGGTGPATAPLRHWPLDDGFGTVARDTTGGFPGSLIGAGDGSAHWDADAPPVPGGPESSLRFDGGSSHVQTTFDGIGGAASRTVVFWLRTTDPGDHGIVSWGDSTANGRKYHIRLNNNSSNGTLGAIRCEVQSGRTVGSAFLADDLWHHVAVVYQEDATPGMSDVRFYIDGALDPKSGTLDFAIDTDISGGNAAPVSIGHRVQGSNQTYFAGKLADVAIYDVALTPAEVADLADGTTRPAGPLTFDEFLATDLEGPMHGSNASVFARAAFDLPANYQPDQLKLRVRYDDGFSAFLNGVEIARHHAPPDDAWNASALAERDDRAAVEPAEFSASLALGSLLPVGNVLALHGLNLAPNDRDCLLDAELSGVELGLTSTGYFLVPTPGAPNGEPDADAFVADTKFSVDRGYHDAPFPLELTTATQGAGIHYTLDGSAPSPTNGTLYTAPITIAKTETVRAAAFKDGHLPTNIDTHTYIFLDTVLAQSVLPPGFPSAWGSRSPDYEMDPGLLGPVYSQQQVRDSLRSLPVISLVMDLDDLFSGATGFYANSTSRGDQWEKPCSFEFFGFPGGAQTQLNGGIRAVGRASRNADRGKHNLRAVFRADYGPKKLRFPLFADSETDEFNSLILRGGNGDSWINPGVVERAQYIRDQWHRDLQRATGQPFQHQIYAQLYINGLYWGMYHVFERFDDDMLSTNFGGSEEDWDAIKDAGSASALEVVDGDLDAWNHTLALASRDLSVPANYAALLEFIEPDTWADYFLMNFYSGNTDWDQSNWRAGRMREAGAKWMLFAWDSERTDRNATQNPNSSTNDVTGKNIANFPSSVHQRMTANPEYRLRFADRVRRHCFHGGALTPEGAETLWNARADEIYEPLVAEAVRWGDRHRNPAARRETPWRTMFTTMRLQFFPQRTDTLLSQLRARGLYPATDAPEFTPHGASFSAPSSVTMTAPTGGTIYYTLDGSDPRRPASAGASLTLLPEGSPVRAVVPIDGSLGQSWTAPEFDDSAWQHGASGVGFEKDAGFEGRFGVDLAAMHGVNASAFARWTFEITDQAALDAIQSLTLRAKFDDGFLAYLNGALAASANPPAVPAWNSSASAGHPDGAALFFEDFDAAPALGALRLGTNVLAVHCLNESADSNDLLFVPELRASAGSIEAGLSPGALAFTGSPVLLDRSSRLNARVFDNGEWSALTSALYTVGTPATAGHLAISEIMYHPAGDAPTEFLELLNLADFELNLAGLRLTDGIDFTFPETALLPPGGRILVVQDVTAFAIAYGLGHPVAGAFENGTRLANGGELLTLSAADGTPIQSFTFRDVHPWPETPDGQDKSLVLIAPETNPDHADPLNWRASLAPGGNPGATDAIPFPGGSAAELLAYALADKGRLRLAVDSGALVLSFEQYLAADDARVSVEFSPNLLAWSPAAGDSFVSRVEHPDGAVTMTFAAPPPGSGDPLPRLFARLRVEQR